MLQNWHWQPLKISSEEKKKRWGQILWRDRNYSVKGSMVFLCRKHLEAVYRAENQVVNGCTGTNIKVSSNGNLLCHSTPVYCLIHLWVPLRKVMGSRRIILSLRKMLDEASHVVLISRRKERKQTLYKPCWEWFRCLQSFLAVFWISSH